MKKILTLALAGVFALGATVNADAQLGKSILQRAKNAAETKVQMEADRAVNKALDETDRAVNKVLGEGVEAVKTADDAVTQLQQQQPGSATVAVPVAAPVGGGKTFYVSESTGGGSRTADGSQAQPYKDLQAAIDAAPDGSVIRIAEGNYRGKMDQGYITLNKYVSLEAGWNTGFTERNPVKYVSSIRLDETDAAAGTSASHAMLDLNPKGNRNATVIIDGIVFEMGHYNRYCQPVADERAGWPEGCETGRMLNLDEGPPVPATEGRSNSRQAINGTMEGNLVIRNCVFANVMHYGIQLQNNYGKWEFCNNLFVSCRMAGCEVRGNTATPDTEKTIDFHHNTVVFTWTRTKLLEDMGYGYRYMTGIQHNVHDNLFGGNYYGALDRTRFDSDKAREAIRVTNAYDNLFFANLLGDICLPSGGGLWNFQYARNFEEVEQLQKYEGNREVNAGELETLKKAINEPYLKGYLGLTLSTSSSYSENSAMNTFRAAMGMNRQGTETVRASMYGNRYPYEDIPNLWGAISGKGAQMPK